MRETIAEAIPIYERMHARRLRPASAASDLRKNVKEALVAGTYTHLDVLEHAERQSVDAAPAAPPVGAAKRKPIGASLSVDEVLFKFKTAHPWSAAGRTGSGTTTDGDITVTGAWTVMLSKPSMHRAMAARRVGKQ